MWKKTEPVFVFRCRFLVLLTHEVTDMLMDVIWYNKSNLQWSCSVCMSLGGVVSRKQQLKDSADMQTDGEGKRWVLFFQRNSDVGVSAARFFLQPSFQVPRFSSRLCWFQRLLHTNCWIFCICAVLFSVCQNKWSEQCIEIFQKEFHVMHCVDFDLSAPRTEIHLLVFLVGGPVQRLSDASTLYQEHREVFGSVLNIKYLHNGRLWGSKYHQQQHMFQPCCRAGAFPVDQLGSAHLLLQRCHVLERWSNQSNVYRRERSRLGKSPEVCNYHREHSVSSNLLLQILIPGPRKDK